LLLGDVEWSELRYIIEYGPGTGEFTRYILERLSPEAQLIVIENDAALADHLRSAISDRRLTVHTESAAHVTSVLGRGALGQVDYIVSGIPFSSLSAEQREQIVNDASILLRPDGQLLAYQVRRVLECHLRAHFQTVTHRRTWLNLPPYHLYWCSNSKARPPCE
jgi:phospholipid N-methyltransferase